MLAHCSTKSLCDRLAITVVITRVSGIVTRAISARSGEMTNIMVTTPITVSSDVRIWLRVCWRLVDTLSMTFVTRLSSSARGMVSK